MRRFISGEYVGKLAVLRIFVYNASMFNQKSISAVEASVFSSCFRKPLYNSYCFSNIPGTIEQLLTGQSTLNQLPADTHTGKTYDKVVLLFVDAFGWRFFGRYKGKYPVLKRFIDNGIVSKLTSQFPSTTAAHATTIHTGLPVGESGVYEWAYYEPKVDTVILPLLYSFAGQKERNLLLPIIEPAEILPNASFYKSLGEKGINTYLFQSSDYTPSPYGSVVTAGLQNQHPFDDWEEGLSELGNALINESGKAYFYYYFGLIDSIAHKYGPSSKEFETMVDSFLTKLEELFFNIVEGKCGNTLLLMTADHGQTDIDPATTIYLNNEIPEIVEWTKRNATGELIILSGSCRDLFLYIKPEYIEVAIKTLADHLKGKAEVHLVEDLMEQGFFGNVNSETLKSRIGNICILPYKNDSVFWWEEGRFEQKYYGHHGGLTPEEMDTIFLTLEI